MRRRKKQHGYQVSVYVGGKRIWRTFWDREAAREWVRQQKSANARNQVGLPDRSKRLRDVWDLIKKGVGSTKIWNARLARDFGDMPVASITRHSIQLWVDKLKMAPGSIKRNLGALKSLLSKAVSFGYIVDNPAKNITLPRLTLVREPYLLTDEEVARVYAAAWSDSIRRALIVAIGTGMRRGEIAALRPAWVDWKGMMIRIPGASTKTGKGRTIPISEEVAEAIRAQASGNERCFPVKGWPRQATRLSLKSGVRFRWHLLRHLFISKLVMAGVSLRVIQEVSGHSSLVMLQRYSHLSPDSIASVRKHLGGMTVVRKDSKDS